MIKLLKNISFYLIISFAFCYLSYTINSKALFQYLSGNLISLLFTLLAINTATTGLIASKIQDIVILYQNMNFKETIRQMKLSLLEQITLIVFSVLIITANDSQIIEFENKEFLFDILLTTVLIYAMAILWDTGKAVFIIIEEIQKL